MKLTDFLQNTGKPIAYYPSLRKITGSTTATILLCQFIYWRGKESDPDGWLYKESAEIEQETGLSYDEQKTARKKLVENGLLEEHYARLDHQMKFRLNLDEINKKWSEVEIPESRKTTFGKAESKYSLNSNTENTTENNHDDSFSKPAKTDETKGEYKLPENSDPAFLMAVGQDITNEAQQARILEHNAITAFEASFSALKPLLWYCGKPKWTHLRRDVVELYKADPQCFEKYKVWRTTPYVKGAVSLKDIQRDPDCFMASWAGFVETVKPQQETNTPKVTIVK